MNKSKAEEHILINYEVCASYCANCYKAKSVCESCASEGQTAYLPSLRACNCCIDNREKCVNFVVMVLCVDCDSGNKGALFEYREEILNETIDPALVLLCVLPYTPHVGKSVKGSFANWFLLFLDEGHGAERASLSTLCTL